MSQENEPYSNEECHNSLDLAPKHAQLRPKDRMSLVPMDIIRKYDVPAYEEGVAEYGYDTWRRGFKVSELVDAAQRHLEEFSHKGEDYDPKPLEKHNIKKHHLAAVRFCCASILHILEHRPELDDRRSHINGEELRKWEKGNQEDSKRSIKAER